MKIIEGDVNLYDLHLTELPEFLKDVHVTGSFNCQRNELTSLKNSPSVVDGYFRCHKNKLSTLEGGPTSVGKHLFCSFNQLTSLVGAPSSVGGNFDCGDNTKEFSETDVMSVCDVKGEIFC